MDDNAYSREGEAFWVRGESRADLMLRAPVVTEATPDGDVVRPLTHPAHGRSGSRPARRPTA